MVIILAGINDMMGLEVLTDSVGSPAKWSKVVALKRDRDQAGEASRPRHRGLDPGRDGRGHQGARLDINGGVLASSMAAMPRG
jgi:hypothetical protein